MSEPIKGVDEVFLIKM